MSNGRKSNPFGYFAMHLWQEVRNAQAGREGTDPAALALVIAVAGGASQVLFHQNLMSLTGHHLPVGSP